MLNLSAIEFEKNSRIFVPLLTELRYCLLHFEIRKEDRTVLSPEMLRQQKPAGQKLPDFDGQAHRCTAHAAIAKYKNQYVALVVRPSALEPSSLLLRGVDLASGADVVINGVPQNDIAQINEFFCFVDNSGALHYHSHGTFNDEFDEVSYRKLVDLIENHHSALF